MESSKRKPKPYFFKRGTVGHKKSSKRQLKTSFLGKEIKTHSPLNDTYIVKEKLSKVQYLMRGFGKRHLNKLLTYMRNHGFTAGEIFHIELSFLKFKFLQMIFPTQRKNLVWIFKHCLTLEGQKEYDQVSDLYLSTGYDGSLSYLQNKYSDRSELERRERLLFYCRDTETTEWLPISVFPPILFEKKRMHLAFREMQDIDQKECRDIFFEYILGLNLEKLFIPPSDILYKVGNQMYNDDGVSKKDFERPTHFRCGFKYQYFLAQPLYPREVWLPDKFIKHNNLFWMIVGRQLLKKSPAYPNSDPGILWEQVKGHLREMMLYFDISGFGLQFPRELLSLMASVIQELYPSDQMEISSSDFYSILDSVKVEVHHDVLYPPRGIGLGYYEDLKTLVMLAILDSYDPISLYGDQGIISRTGPGPILRLWNYNFIIPFEQGSDKIQFRSHPRIKWAGHGMSQTNLYLCRTRTNSLVGAFFTKFHWQRKAALASYCEDNYIFYKKNYKKICFAYTQFFGNEFFEGDLNFSFIEGGINPSKAVALGSSKFQVVSEYLKPFEDTFFEVLYITPFLKKESKVYSHGMSKQFQEKRLQAYKRHIPIDSSVYFYSKPRLQYNRKIVRSESIIPAWADLLFLCEYGASMGNFSYGLDQEKLSMIAGNHSLSSDPLRAAARGGYKILDPVYSLHRPLSSEWQYVCNQLEKVDKRYLPYMPRADLGYPPPYYWEEDMYKGVDLYEPLIRDSLKKRKRSIAFSESSLLENVKGRVIEEIHSQVPRGIIDSLEQIPDLINQVIEDELDQEYGLDYENLSDDEFLE